MSNEFKLVPVEPTDEMVSAVLDLGRIDPDDVACIWGGMLAAAPQPPAIGGEPEIIGYGQRDSWGNASMCLGEQPGLESLVRLRDHRAHIAPLQAEIKRLASAQMEMAELYFLRGKEIDKLKARCDELEGHKIVLKFGLRSIEGYKGRTTVGELKSMAKVTADRVEQLEEALSKPAGSEKV